MIAAERRPASAARGGAGRVAAAAIAVLGLLVTSPLVMLAALAIWLQDRHNPIYMGPRVGLDGGLFRMWKLRSMVPDADRSQVISTAGNDPRLTALGRFLRTWKVDELPQLVNVVAGTMSLVGPRPQVPSLVARYTTGEMALLSIRPGITDLASIVFSDLEDIYRAHPDPDAAYDTVIRPWKSRLGLFYVQHRGVRLDTSIFVLALVNVLFRRPALAGVAWWMRRLGAPEVLLEVASRRHPIPPAAPPHSVDQMGLS